MRVLLLDRNEAYAERFAQYLGKQGDIQVSLCNDLDICKKMLNEELFQVVLFDAEFDTENPADYSRKMTAFAFISSVKDKIKDTDTIYKYSSVSEIIEEIMRIYTEHTQHEIKEDFAGDGGSAAAEVLTFLPANGGAGSTTMAQAASIALATRGRTLYLNLEQRPADTLVFTSESKKCITDVIAALRTNFQLKEAKKLLDTVIISDTAHGGGNLDFIKGYLNIFDCTSLTPQLLETLLTILRKQFQYRYIIIDADFMISDLLRRLIVLSDKLIFVSTGTDSANRKTEGIHRYLEIIEREEDSAMPKKYLLFNQYYGMQNEEAVARDMKIIGKIGRYRSDDRSLLSAAGVVAQIVNLPGTFDALV